MEQRRRHAVVKDARVLLRKEECVLGMGQRLNDAAVEDALTKEECAGGTVQNSNYAAVKDAQIFP